MAPALPAGQGDDRRAGGPAAGPAPRVRRPLRHRHLGRHRHVPVGVRAHPAQRPRAAGLHGPRARPDAPVDQGGQERRRHHGQEARRRAAARRGTAARQARFGQGPGHHLRGDRHRLPVHRRGARVQEPAHPLQHQRRGDRRVHAGLRPGHEDRLPAAPQRSPGGHLRHRHPDRQLGHRGLRDAALPAPGPARRPRASRSSTPGRPPSARSSPRSSWPPKAAATSG